MSGIDANGFTQQLSKKDINHPLYNKYMDYWGDVAGNDYLPLSFEEWLQIYNTKEALP